MIIKVMGVLVLIAIVVISGWLWLDTDPFSAYAYMPWEMNEWRVIQLRCAFPAFSFSTVALLATALCYWSTRSSKRDMDEIRFKATMGSEPHHFLITYGIAAFEAKYGSLEAHLKKNRI